nr:hypothetical protein [Propionicimonas sp.]
MTGSRATTAWVVSGAIGLVTFTAGMLVSQGGSEAVSAEPRPAITVTPGSVKPSPTATKATAKPTKATPKPTKPTPPATATAATAPSPVSPPSAETPD